MLFRSGGVITGNAAYENNDFSAGNINHDHGDGVYVYSKDSVYQNGSSILLLSGSASIDSSNNVSFSFNTPGGLPVETTDVYVFDSLYSRSGWNYTAQTEMYYDGSAYISKSSAYYDAASAGILTAEQYTAIINNASESRPYKIGRAHV